MRRTIRKAAPEAKETIRHRTPTYMLSGPVIHFAAFPDHINLHPAPRGQRSSSKESAAYKGGKGTVQLPLDKPIPFGLITRIVKYRMKENQARAAAKGRRK